MVAGVVAVVEVEEEAVGIEAGEVCSGVGAGEEEGEGETGGVILVNNNNKTRDNKDKGAASDSQISREMFWLKTLARKSQRNSLADVDYLLVM